MKDKASDRPSTMCQTDFRILAIDTTSEFGSLALFGGGEVAAELPLHSKEGFSQTLYAHIETLLEQNGWALADIDCFAAATGPGSFTGVRVGLAAVKGLAEALAKPAVGVSSLQALASFGNAALRATVLDARRGQVYAAVYDAALELVSPEVVARLPDWLRALPSGDLEFISGGVPELRSALAGTPLDSAPVLEAPPARAGAIARIAATRLHAGCLPGPAELDANYVRRSDAELFWKE